MTKRAMMMIGDGQAEFDLAEPSDKNPFSEAMAQGFRTRTRRTGTGADLRAVVNMETRVIEGSAEICKIEDVDPEQFMKVFSAQLGAIYALPPRATKLLIVMWDIYSREAKKRKETAPLDYVEITLGIYDDLARKNGGAAPSKPTYHRAVNDLLNAGFIAAGDRAGRFWINPAVFFIGSRIRLIQEIRKAPDVLAKTDDCAVPDDLRDITPEQTVRPSIFQPDGSIIDAETGEIIGRSLDAVAADE